MKRALKSPEGAGGKRKKTAEESLESDGEREFILDEDVLFEVFKHMDSRTLGIASCVSPLWHRTATDERLWEIMCGRHWANATGCTTSKLRSVVLALGGFRRLHSLYLWPLLKPPASSSSSSSSSTSKSSSPSSFLPGITGKTIPNNSARLGKDEVHLSLSLLSIRYYEKMNLSARHHRNNFPSEAVLHSNPKPLLKDSN